VVYVDGRKVKVLRGRRLRAVTLTGLPRGTFQVQVRSVTSRGRHVREIRTYRACAAQQRHAPRRLRGRARRR
jgi:hypothetical protein